MKFQKGKINHFFCIYFAWFWRLICILASGLCRVHFVWFWCYTWSLLYFVAKSGKPVKYSFSSVQRACGDGKGGETTRWRRHDDEETRRWRRHGDEAALTRWHDDMAMRWTLCGDNMTTGRRNSAERRGLLSRIAAMVTTAMVTAPTAAIYYQNACNLPISMIFCQQGYQADG